MRLRKTIPAYVKIYVLTAQAFPEEQVKLKKMGFDGILMKPFHSYELLDLLQSTSENSPTTVQNPPFMLASDKPDFTVLEEMTFGDETLLKEILEQFVKDTRQDMDRLRLAMTSQDQEDIPEVTHKLSGRIGQIGAHALSAKFRTFEISLREDADSISSDELESALLQTDSLIDHIDEKILSYSI